MTEREICERIVADGGCMSISCYGHDWALNIGVKCPLFGTCLSQIDASVARQWLADHPVACEYCRDDFGKQIIDKFGMNVYVYKKTIVGSYCDDDGHIIEADALISYCPVCGRKLGERG